MNKKDLASIRRRFAPEKNDISIIRGYFVNEKGEIVSTFSKSPISLPESEAEHYLASFKKTLGGAVGRNQFTLPVHTDDAALLRQLQSTELTDDAAVNALFNTIREKMDKQSVYIEAQTYTIDFYGKVGFRVAGEEFLEDGIPHVPMMMEL